MTNQNEQEVSFHGKLILAVMEYWAAQILFEQNDQRLRDKFEDILNTYIPNFIDIAITWNDDPIFIDKNAVVGDVFFTNENGVNRCMNFYITATRIKTKENEEKN